MINYLAGWSRISKKNYWKISFKEICERTFLHRPLWMGEKLNIFLFHVNGHHRVISAEEDLTIKWIWWSVLWIPISLSLAFSIITQWAHKQSSHSYKNGIFVQAEQRGLPPTKANLSTDTAECPVCQPWKPILSPWYGSIAQVISQQLSGGRLITMVCFHHFHHGRATFCSHWIRHLFWIQIFHFL